MARRSRSPTVSGREGLRFGENGFRAPPLKQQYFATTATNCINGMPFDITTFLVTDPVAQAIGAENLSVEYPDPYFIARNSTGNTPYSNYSPFGRSGRFVYGRITFNFD